jgi:GTP 3',8-cyclase
MRDKTGENRLIDSFGREITYLRISVTNRCNLYCRYCRPHDCVFSDNREDTLTVDQIARVVCVAADLGIRKIRLTGGEPLVRADILRIVESISACSRIEHLAMTTNGVLLPKYAAGLKEAGLDSLNISLDSLDSKRYESITGIRALEKVLGGISAAKKEGFPIKINTVVSSDTTGQEIESIRAFCRTHGLMPQLIDHYDLNSAKRDDYTLDRPPKCAECNRIRLLADGVLKPCLHSNQEIPLDMNDIRGSLIETVQRKPRAGSVCTNRSMSQIGG